MKKYAALALFLSGCVGATLSDTSSIEEYPNRAATEKEARRLKYCLEGIHSIQKAHYKDKKQYIKKASRLPADDFCHGIIVTMKPREGGYFAFAQINESETTVKWSINENGKMIEYTDPEMDEDLF